jgi:hypothetical protein
MQWTLGKYMVLMKCFRLIKDVYNNIVTSVWINDKDTNDFPIKIDLVCTEWDALQSPAQRRCWG